MTQGVYSAGAAMARIELLQEVTANNLANAATTGFRRDLVTAREAGAGEPGITRGPLRLGRVETAVMLDGGAIEPTGGRGDLAIRGEGFFVVEKDGESFLTRAGSFTRNANGELTSASGERLMGESGPITVESDEFTVSPNGEVSVAGATVNTVRLANTKPGAVLRKAGEGRLEMPADGEAAAPADSSILQGFLEGSNVSAIREMVTLVEAFRSYQANSKSIMTADELLDSAVNQVGRVA
ncbi:MAG: flagellar hook-basal body protein [bacterium]